MAEREDLIRGLAEAMSSGGKKDLGTNYDPETGTFYVHGSQVTKEMAEDAIRFFEEKANSVSSPRDKVYYNTAAASIKKCLLDDKI